MIIYRILKNNKRNMFGIIVLTILSGLLITDVCAQNRINSNHLSPPSQVMSPAFRIKFATKSFCLSNDGINKYISSVIDKYKSEGMWNDDVFSTYSLSSSMLQGNFQKNTTNLSSINVVKIDGLLANTGHFSHIGFSGKNEEYNGYPVIYIDSKLFKNKRGVALKNAIDIILQWEEFREKYLDNIERRGMRNWIDSHLEKPDKALESTKYEGLTSLDISRIFTIRAYPLDVLYKETNLSVDLDYLSISYLISIYGEINFRDREGPSSSITPDEVKVESIIDDLKKKIIPKTNGFQVRRKAYDQLFAYARAGFNSALRAVTVHANSDNLFSVEIYNLMEDLLRPELVDIFLEGLDHDYFAVITVAKRCLTALGDTAHSKLVEMLRTGDENSRRKALSTLMGKGVTREMILNMSRTQEVPAESGSSDLTVLFEIDKVYDQLSSNNARLAQNAFRLIGKRGYAANVGERFVSENSFKTFYPVLSALIKIREAYGEEIIIHDSGASDLTGSIEFWNYLMQDKNTSGKLRMEATDLFMPFFVLYPMDKDPNGIEFYVFNVAGDLVQIKKDGKIMNINEIKLSFPGLQESITNVFNEIDRDTTNELDGNSELYANTTRGRFFLRSGVYRNPEAEKLRKSTNGRFNYGTRDIFRKTDEEVDIMMLFNVVFPEAFNADQIQKILNIQGQSLKDGGFLVIGYHSSFTGELEKAMGSTTSLNYGIYRREGNYLKRYQGLAPEETGMDPHLLKMIDYYNKMGPGMGINENEAPPVIELQEIESDTYELPISRLAKDMDDLRHRRVYKGAGEFNIMVDEDVEITEKTNEIIYPIEKIDKKYFEIRYDSSRLSEDQIGLLNAYVNLLKGKVSDPSMVELIENPSRGDSKRDVFNVRCWNDISKSKTSFIGSSSIDITFDPEEKRLEILKMLNMVIIVATIPMDANPYTDISEYDREMNIISQLYLNLTGKTIDLTDPFSAIRKIKIQNAQRLPTEELKIYYNICISKIQKAA